MQVPQLRVEAPERFRSLAARIAQIDPAELQIIQRLIGPPSDNTPITVVLAPEESEIAHSTPRWIAGFARADQNVVVVFPARSPSYPFASLDDVLRHEIAHVLTDRAAGESDVPRWFHEGLALTAERAWGLEDRTRVAFALSGRRLTGRDLDAAFANEGTAASAYAISGARVRDLIARHGTDAPARVLSHMAGGMGFEEAFAAATGESVAASEDAFWRESWWSQAVPFFTSSLVLWMAVTLLALFAIRTRRARRAKRRALWAIEEQRQHARAADAAPDREE